MIELLVLLIVWLVPLSFIVARAAKERGRGRGWAWFFAALFFTPPMAALLLLAFPVRAQQ